jgi:cytoskeletal protein CcmA (bactofilin family)
MFKKSVKSPITLLNQEEILTILGEDFECDGNIKNKSNTRIEGKVNGDVVVKKGVILGEKGIINGNLETETAIIFGLVKGNVKVKHLEIKQTGSIHGDVKTENLVVELGGKYNGKLDMQNINDKQTEQKSQKELVVKKPENTILNDFSF